jgi:hypothetical protein
MKKVILFLLFLQAFGFYSFGQDSTDVYWDNPKYATLGLDSPIKEIQADKKLKQEQDSIKLQRKNRDRKNRDRKNTIRLEFFGKSTFLGLIYERQITNSQKPIFISAGAGKGVGRSESFFDMFNLSLYLKLSNKTLKPLIGVGSVLQFDFTPYPSSISERNEIRANPGNSASYFSPPLTVFYYPVVGLEINFSSSLNSQLIFSPLFGYDYYDFLKSVSNNTILGYRVWAGINFGYKF